MFIVDGSSESQNRIASLYERSSDRDTKLVLISGDVVHGKSVLVTPQKVSIVANGTTVEFPIEQIKKISIINRWSGALAGAGIGAIPGAVLVAIGLGSNSSSAEGRGYAIFFGAIGMGGGAALGAITGAIIGSREEYEIIAPTAPKKTIQ
jgi:hypothetical protein